MKKTVPIVIYSMVGLVIGLLIVQQFYAYQKLNRMDARDPSPNAFREIKVLQENNGSLAREVRSLEEKLKEYTSQAKKLDALQEDIRKNQILAGAVPVAGPGISLKIDRNIEVIWMIDLVNELFSAGAEAVAVNDIRITGDTIGFSHVGQQITLGGVTISAPFIITAIGKTDTLYDALDQSAGILKRLQAQYPGLSIILEKETVIEMPASPSHQ